MSFKPSSNGTLKRMICIKAVSQPNFKVEFGLNIDKISGVIPASIVCCVVGAVKA